MRAVALVGSGVLVAAVLYVASMTSDRHMTYTAATPPDMAPAALRPAVTAPKMAPALSTAPTFFPPSCAATPPQRYARVIVKAGMKHGVDPCLLARQTKAESNFDPKARSPAGAIGISQFLPATAKEWGIDPWDPEQAIKGQAAYLRWNMDRWTPDLPGRTRDDIDRLGVAAYNHGFGAMLRNQRRHGWITWRQAQPAMPTETQGYVRRIFD